MNRNDLEPSGGAPQPEAGFSLIEVLIAIIILVFGIVAVANLILIAATSNMVANHSTAAVTVGSEAMEALKAAPIGTLVPGRTTAIVRTTSTAGGAVARERVTTVQVDTTIRTVPAVGFHIVVVATPINAFNIRGYNAGVDADNPPPTRSQAVFTTFRSAE